MVFLFLSISPRQSLCGLEKNLHVTISGLSAFLAVLYVYYCAIIFLKVIFSKNHDAMFKGQLSDFKVNKKKRLSGL